MFNVADVLLNVTGVWNAGNVITKKTKPYLNMKTKKLLLLAALCMACTGFATAQSIVLETTTPFEQVDIGTPVAQSKIWAVVVGIERYRDENCLSNLRFSKTDALKIQSYLQYQLGVPPEQIETLLDENATAKNILKKTEAHFKKATKNDMIFFYYAGHGACRKLLPNDYTCPDDGSLPYADLKYDNIEKILETCAAKKQIIIVDACQTNNNER